MPHVNEQKPLDQNAIFLFKACPVQKYCSPLTPVVLPCFSASLSSPLVGRSPPFPSLRHLALQRKASTFFFPFVFSFMYEPWCVTRRFVADYWALIDFHCFPISPLLNLNIYLLYILNYFLLSLDVFKQSLTFRPHHVYTYLKHLGSMSMGWMDKAALSQPILSFLSAAHPYEGLCVWTAGCHSR